VPKKVGLASLHPSIRSILISSLKSNSLQLANTTQPVLSLVSPFCRSVLRQINKLNRFTQQTYIQACQRNKGRDCSCGATHGYTRSGITWNHTLYSRKPRSQRPSRRYCGQRTIFSSDNIPASPPKKILTLKEISSLLKAKGSRNKNSSHSDIPKHGLNITPKLYFEDNVCHNARFSNVPL